MLATTSRPALPFLTFALALGLYGCGGAHWHRPDADSVAAANDQKACRKDAQAKFGTASALAMQSSNDPRFGPMGPSQTDLRMQESQAVSACMRKKGYVLVPDAN
ncbi:MAG: hypothetical protein EXR33_06345 [Betaproteobacteria bacterium]|nr:hypothetical protein [Betaproteobacteria bacterium]